MKYISILSLLYTIIYIPNVNASFKSSDKLSEHIERDDKRSQNNTIKAFEEIVADWAHNYLQEKKDTLVSLDIWGNTAKDNKNISSKIKDYNDLKIKINHHIEYEQATVKEGLDDDSDIQWLHGSSHSSQDCIQTIEQQITLTDSCQWTITKSFNSTICSTITAGYPPAGIGASLSAQVSLDLQKSKTYVKTREVVRKYTTKVKMIPDISTKLQINVARHGFSQPFTLTTKIQGNIFLLYKKNAFPIISHFIGKTIYETIPITKIFKNLRDHDEYRIDNDTIIVTIDGIAQGQYGGQSISSLKQYPLIPEDLWNSNTKIEAYLKEQQIKASLVEHSKALEENVSDKSKSENLHEPLQPHRSEQNETFDRIYDPTKGNILMINDIKALKEEDLVSAHEVDDWEKAEFK